MPPRAPSMAPPTDPTLIYDGECGICRQAVALLERWDREHVLRFVPFQDARFAGGDTAVTTAVLSSDTVRQALRQVKDPELDMNIVDLGLVYDVEVDEGLVRINMTLTSPGCPAGPMITNDIYKVVRALDGVKDVDIDIVWEPYWTPERIDPKIRAMMGF